MADGDSFSGSPQTLGYSPDANYNGADSFKFTVTDTGDPVGCSTSPPACDAPLTSLEQTVAITVNPVNDRPTTSASPSSLNLNEDGSTTVAVSGADVETGEVGRASWRESVEVVVVVAVSHKYS